MIGAKRSSAKAAFMLLSAAALPAMGQTVITQWNFASTASAPDNSPAPTGGVNAASGVANSLGMTNQYTYAGTTATNSITSDDITSTSGTLNTNFTENTWRIRGVYASTGVAPNNGTVSKSANVNGWNLSAPQYSQGAEFDTSTVGFSDIQFNFDWYCTTQGILDMQEQYNTNINNPNGWTNINPLQLATSNDYANNDVSPTNTIDLSAISGAANDPNLGIRLVSAYNPADGTYDSSAGGVYNNDSGNWRFGDITFSGTAVPEPASASIFAIGAFGLAMRRRRAAK